MLNNNNNMVLTDVQQSDPITISFSLGVQDPIKKKEISKF